MLQQLLYRTMSNTDMSLFSIVDTVMRNSNYCLRVTMQGDRC